MSGMVTRSSSKYLNKRKSIAVLATPNSATTTTTPSAPSRQSKRRRTDPKNSKVKRQLSYPKKTEKKEDRVTRVNTGECRSTLLMATSVSLSATDKAMLTRFAIIPLSSSSSSSSSSAAKSLPRECDLCYDKESEDNPLSQCTHCLEFYCSTACLHPCIGCTNNHCAASMLKCEMDNCDAWMCRDCTHKQKDCIGISDINSITGEEIRCNNTICCQCIETGKAGRPCSGECGGYWCDQCSSEAQCLSCMTHYCLFCKPVLTQTCTTPDCYLDVCNKCAKIQKGQCRGCWHQTSLDKPLSSNS